MRRKLICAVFAAIIALIFLAIFNIVQHISLPGSIQGWFSGEDSVSYLNLPCYETNADTSGGENRTTEDEENGETSSDQPSFQVSAGQIFGLVIGLIFFALFIRFCFDHFVR